MDADLDTLATELYVRTDDLLKAAPEWAPCRPATGIAPKVSDAELVTLAVMQALLGYVSVSEARWLRHARTHLAGLFPYLPGQSGYNKRLRKLPATMIWLIRNLATDTSWWHDDVWVIDSTPVECGPPAALSAGHRRSRRDCAHRPATASAVLAWCTVATCPAGASGA